MGAEANDALQDEANEFASRISRVLEATVTDDAPVVADLVENRLTVAPVESGAFRPITLQHDGQPVIDLWLRYFCRWDSYGSYLAVEHSKVQVCLHRVSEPLMRFEYERARTDGLDAHIQVHGQNDRLGWLAGVTGKLRHPFLPSIHLPVGGRRFRTSLEDIIEMAIRDLGVDPKPGWNEPLNASRDEWLDTQTQAVVRDRPDKAAQTLQELGWSVTPPEQ